MPALTKQLESTDWRSRELAAAGLGTIGPAASSTTDKLAALLRDGDSDVRSAALQALSQIDPNRTPAMPALRTVPDDRQVDDRTDNLIAGPFDTEGVAGRFAGTDRPAGERRHANDGEDACRQGVAICSTAAVGLAQYGREAKPALKPLIASLKDSNGYVRTCAIEALGRIGQDAQAATADLIERWGDDSPPVRSAAARA